MNCLPPIRSPWCAAAFADPFQRVSAGGAPGVVHEGNCDATSLNGSTSRDGSEWLLLRWAVGVTVQECEKGEIDADELE